MGNGKLQLPCGVANRLASLLHQKLLESGNVSLNRVSIPTEIPRPVVIGQRLPRGKGSFGNGDGLVDISLLGQGNMIEKLLCAWVDSLTGLGGGRESVVDDVLKIGLPIIIVCQ